uniref:Staphylococcal nuclease domain-containing protein n=1 Tax=Macrostomum lignano TaxID=282301 RepID=A0A1I8I6V4_9PLAT
MAVSGQNQLLRGTVKLILSGDSLIIRDRPRGGPPQEWNCGLTSIQAPRLGRRLASGEVTKDEPWAYESREYLRRLVGKEVLFACETIVGGTGNKKYYGVLYDRVEPESERVNMNEALVREGLAEVRRTGGGGGGGPSGSDQMNQLGALEDQAKADGKGKWSQTEPAANHVRNVVWKVDNPRLFVDSHKQRPLNAIIEHRNVRLVLETVSGQSVVGSVLHTNGNIAEILVQEGLARCVDWSMGVVSQPGAAVKLRQAERDAKKARRRLWKDYVETAGSGGGIGHSNKSEKGLKSGDNIEGRVVEVGNGDSLVVKRQDTGDYVKLFLASIRPPRANAPDADGQRPKVSRPLYDIPYMFEAREFLRKRLIGKRITARVDYVQPKSPEFPEKVGATVLVGEVNVAEALVQKGLGYVIRYRADDDNRSSAYDALLAAEAVAQKKAAGVHSKKEPPAHKISDLAGDPKRAKQFLPSLQRSGRQEALVEFVASANRFRVYVPRSTCLVTLLLTGVECPRTPRRLPNGSEEPGEPFGEEASRFVKELCLQREVEVLVEACDRGGNFIGHLFVDGENLAVSLVEKGYGKVHFTAEKSDYYPALSKAEEKAKADKLNVWSVASTTDNGRAESAASGPASGQRKDAAGGGEDSGPLECTVTEIRPDLSFCVQLADDAERRTRLAAALREELEERRPPVPGAYAPRKGDLCAVRFNSAWQRARVLKSDSTGKTVSLIDLGLEKIINNVADIAQLPDSLRAQAPLARVCRLAFSQPPPDEEDIQLSVELMLDTVANKPATVRRVYESDGVAYVQLVEKASGVDVAELLLEKGLLFIDRRPPMGSKSGKGGELYSKYAAKQAVAFKARLNIWRYGDFRDDDD